MSMTNDHYFTQRGTKGITTSIPPEAEVASDASTWRFNCSTSGHYAIVSRALCMSVFVWAVADAQYELLEKIDCIG